MNAFDVVETILGWVWGQVAAHPVGFVVLLVAWASAELLWRSIHRDPHERPHVGTRRVRGSRRAIERAARKDKKAGHQNYWPLPGRLKAAAEFLYIVGGSGTGKTLRILLYLIAYRLIQGRRSVWMIDPKGELYGWTKRLLGILSGYPAVHLISTLEKHKKRPISPVNPMIDPEERLGFLRTAVPGTDGSKDTFFDSEAQRLSYRTAEAQITERGGTDLWLVYRALDDPEELDRLAAAHPRMRSVWRGSDAQKGTHHDARATALAALFALDVPRISRIFRTNGLATEVWETSPDFAERTVGYLCVSAFDADSAPGLIRATVDHLMRRAAGATERGGPKVDAILEEAGTFGPLEQLNFYINLLRGAGVNIVVVLQSIEQLWARLGRNYANSALSAGGCFVFGRMSSPESARWVEELAGTTRVARPREYTPIWLGVLEAILDDLSSMLSGGMGDDGGTGPKTSRSHGTDRDESLVVPRFPARCLYGFDLDPDLQEGWWEKQRSRIKLWWGRRWVMRVGQYLVLAHGKDPFVLDTRRHRQIFPHYGPQNFRRFLKNKNGGKWGRIRYRTPVKKSAEKPGDLPRPADASKPAGPSGPMFAEGAGRAPSPESNGGSAAEGTESDAGAVHYVPRVRKPAEDLGSARQRWHKRSEGLRAEDRKKECPYCGYPNDASAERCEIETCGTPLP